MTTHSILGNDAPKVLFGRLRTIDQLVIASVLASVLTKIQAFLIGFRVYRMLPLRDEFFPQILQNPWVYLVLYFSVVALATVSLIVRSRPVTLAIRGGLLCCLYVLCIHQQTYNDVTFVTCFWTVAWSAWFVWETGRRPEIELLTMATTFSHLILSLIFLGGAVGKMTPGYWSGEAIYGIYFESRNYWCFNLIRENISAEAIPELAKWYSRVIIMTECICSFLWLMPPRLASTIAFLTLFGIAFFSNFMLFSVVGCLMGLALVGLFAPSQTAAGDERPVENKTTGHFEPQRTL